MANHVLSNPTSYGNRTQDPIVTANMVISEPHSMSHRGWMHHYSKKITGVINGGTVLYLIKVPADTYPHLHRMRTNAGRGDIDIIMYESPTVSADGTLQTSQNTNRNSGVAPGMQIYLTPTVSADGTEIHSVWGPPTSTGTGLSASGLADVSEGEEWLLAPSTNYLRRITNNSGVTISIWVEFLWYEVGDS